MTNRGLFAFLVKWLVSSLGLWIAASLLTQTISYNSQAGVIIIAGFILAIINTIIRPILIFLSIPALFLTLGLFMLIINGFSVYLVSRLYHSFYISSFYSAIFAGMVIGLVNYLVTTILTS